MSHAGFLKTCDSYFKPLAASTAYPFTPRQAVDPNGRLGLLYDAYSDRVLGPSNISFTPQSMTTRSSPHCSVEKLSVGGRRNLLELFNLHGDLGLNIALNITHANGIGALIKHTDPINRYTRFLSFMFLTRTEYFHDRDLYSMKTKMPLMDSQATHVTVLVNWGIDATVVLQLPEDEQFAKHIDYVLMKLCNILSERTRGEILNSNDLKLLENIRHTKAYSNIQEISQISTIVDLYRCLPTLKTDSWKMKPYNYNLYPVDQFYALNGANRITFREIGNRDVIVIESYLWERRCDFKKAESMIEQDHSLLRQKVPAAFSETQQKWNAYKQLYSTFISKLADEVLRVRRGYAHAETILRLINDTYTLPLVEKYSEITTELEEISKKQKFIQSLHDKGFKYENAADRYIDENDDERTLDRKLVTTSKTQRILCSNDDLCKNNPSKFESLCNQMMKEHQNNKDLELIYVDFSYCTYKLNGFLLLPRKQENKVETPRQPETTSEPSQPKTNDTINIVLLGESGVGKSTFINALANYLKFDTLQEATKQPIVLIPVRFLMAVNNDFEEKVIKFEGEDKLCNEDLDNRGQSVTQHCKSYVFRISAGEDVKKKLRIIDTPGIGDTRGIAQDDGNLEHILSYITNLTHVNAICILLKPNQDKLNVFFRSCVIQLIDMLGIDICEKILFCFTNSRSTFYTPGDTGPVLRKLLESIPDYKVPFAKENTFCFDSESFRYLVAKLNRVDFEELEAKEYEESWKKSSLESKRLLEHVKKRTSIRIIPSECRSRKYAQVKMNGVIRPVLETIRNLLRNIILLEKKPPSLAFELRPMVLECASGICLKCRPVQIRVGDFWVTRDNLHVFRAQCRTCSCDPSDHYSVGYQLEYEEGERENDLSVEEMKAILNNLWRVSTEIIDSLYESIDLPEYDPFLLWLNRMINEEEEICAAKKPCELNKELKGKLEELREKYMRCRRITATGRISQEMSDIFDKIVKISDVSMVRKQMAAVAEWNKLMLKLYEYEAGS